MKAVQLHSHGGVDVLEYGDIPDPVIRPNEVLVRVRACALNHLDLWIRNGIPGTDFPLPHILGSDMAGDVVQVGSLCQRIRVGQRVALAPGLSCRQCAKCLDGKDNECRQHTLYGSGVQGGYRELMPAAEYSVLPIPTALDYPQAAAAPTVFSTAWHMLVTKANLQPGEDVLVLSGSSGIGMAAIQIAKLLRCRVITTVGDEAKRAKALQLGADAVIDHHRGDVHQEVRRLTNRRGVDVVVEHVGAATWGQSLQSLANDGRLVTCGATTGYDVRFDLRFLYTRRQSLIGASAGTLADVHKVFDLIFKKQLEPVVDTIFPLQQAREAHSRLERKEHFGKIVLAI